MKTKAIVPIKTALPISSPEPSPIADWCVYIIEATDGRWYTGITNHLPKRWLAHTDGRGAKFFRGRHPARLLYSESQPDRRLASQREAAIKKLSRQQKSLIIKQQTQLPDKPL